MELNEYQKQAMTTCKPTSNNFAYMFLNLVAEVGEFAGKVSKHIRKAEGEISENQLDLFVFNAETGEREDWEAADHALMMEAGDILWQLSGLCEIMGWELDEVAKANLEKLAIRKANGTIEGNGDGVTKEERSK